MKKSQRFTSPDLKVGVFVIIHRPAVGYKVVRILFDELGQPIGFKDFLTGFLANNRTAFFARPTGPAMAADGSLLIGGDTGGVFYRVSSQGNETIP